MRLRALGLELLPAHRERVCMEMLADAIATRESAAAASVPLDARVGVIRAADKAGPIDNCLPLELARVSQLMSQIVARLLADSNREASAARAAEARAVDTAAADADAPLATVELSNDGQEDNPRALDGILGAAGS